MDLSNFEDELEDQIVMRGQLLYMGGEVRAIREESPGHWVAKVQGSYLYSTEIQLNGDRVIDYDCDCPYDWGPVCKHIVATALAIQHFETPESLENTSSGSAPLTFRQEMEQFAKGLKRKDLLDFIIEECNESRNHPLFDAFKLRFAGRIEKVPKPNYGKMVAQALKRAESEGEWGFIDEYYIEEVLGKLLKRAHQQLQDNNWEEVFEICDVILAEIPEQIEEIHEDISEVEDGVISSIGLLGELLVHSKAPEDLKTETIDYMSQNLRRSDLREWGFDTYLWEALQNANPTQDQLKDLGIQLDLILLDFQTRSGGSHWQLETWLERKKQFLIQTGKANEIPAFLEQFIHITKVREYFVEEEIKAGRYYKAKRLIREGIQIEDEKGLRRNVAQWQKKLLEIAKFEEDDSAIRVLAVQLFWKPGLNFEYYETLKSTYSSEDWKNQVEIMMDRIRGGKERGAFGLADEIATILTKEEYWDRLLFLLQQNDHSYELIQRFSGPLMDLYPEELLKMYQKAIESHAESHTGRPAYHSLVKMLKSLSKLKGGATVRKHLLKQFRREYKRRSAMMEILNKAYKT